MPYLRLPILKELINYQIRQLNWYYYKKNHNKCMSCYYYIINLIIPINDPACPNSNRIIILRPVPIIPDQAPANKYKVPREGHVHRQVWYDRLGRIHPRHKDPQHDEASYPCTSYQCYGCAESASFWQRQSIQYSQEQRDLSWLQGKHCVY